jgi:SAM-dependent methyltransferase
MTDPLPFTGERFTPECVREIWYEHWHRYALARRWARGKRVLDVACGEGYGSALLAPDAASVLGIDIDADAVRHAQSRYAGFPNLRFAVGDATRLDVEAGAHDLVTSFETLEHVAAQDELVAGLRRALAPGGVALISSPDRRTYSDAVGFTNPYHVRELYRDELEALLARHFGAVRLFGQKLLFQSAIWDLAAAPARCVADTSAGQGAAVDDGLAYAPIYYIAVCAERAEHLPADLDGLTSWFGDATESVYRHYEHEIRKNMQAGGIIAERDAEIAALKARVAALEAPKPISAAILPDADVAVEPSSAAAPAAGGLARLRNWLGR